MNSMFALADDPHPHCSGSAALREDADRLAQRARTLATTGAVLMLCAIVAGSFAATAWQLHWAATPPVSISTVSLPLDALNALGRPYHQSVSPDSPVSAGTFAALSACILATAAGVAAIKKRLRSGLIAACVAGSAALLVPAVFTESAPTVAARAPIDAAVEQADEPRIRAELAALGVHDAAATHYVMAQQRVKRAGNSPIKGEELEALRTEASAVVSALALQPDLQLNGNALHVIEVRAFGAPKSATAVAVATVGQPKADRLLLWSQSAVWAAAALLALGCGFGAAAFSMRSRCERIRHLLGQRD